MNLCKSLGILIVLLVNRFSAKNAKKVSNLIKNFSNCNIIVVMDYCYIIGIYLNNQGLLFLLEALHQHERQHC